MAGPFYSPMFVGRLVKCSQIATGLREGSALSWLAVRPAMEPMVEAKCSLDELAWTSYCGYMAGTCGIQPGAYDRLRD